MISVVVRRLRWWLPLVVITIFLGFPLNAQEKAEISFDAEIQLDQRIFLNEGIYEGQEQYFFSIAANPEWDISWDRGKQNVVISLFGRFDQHDENRTHFDIRELYYQKVKGNLELSIGLKKVFWGVTESAHLVDIINQTDQVESFDGEQKLGQPMAHLSYFSNWGTFDVFYMPYSRRRQFPDTKGRLRFPIVIERSDIDVDRDWEQWYPSFAFRWSHYFGPMDIGVLNFYGVGREPLFLTNEDGTINAFYPIINQTGLDVQATTGPVLWKMETIYRYAEEQDFTAVAIGFEYTFGNLFSKGYNLGILGEYLFDSRDELALNNLDNDVFVGMRLALNDTQSSELLAGAIFDMERKTTFYSVEASRRLWDSWKVEIESRVFQDVSSDEFAYFFREDSFLQFRVAKFF